MGLVQISLNLLSILIFLLPLFFNSLTFDYYETNKQALLLLFVPLLLVFWTLMMFKEKKVSLTLNKLNLPVVFLAVAFVVSTIFGANNKVESLVTPLGTGVIVALAFLYFVIVNLPIKKEQIVYPLMASAFVLSVMFILQYLRLSEKILPYDFLKDKLWTPAGALIGLLVFLTAVLPLAIEEGLSNSKNTGRSLLGWITSLVVSLGLVTGLIAVFKDAKPLLLPYDASWAIAVDNLRNIKSALIGVGPGHFINAFTQSKPLAINNGNLWSLRFTTSGSYLLQILTEAGLFSFIAYLILMLKAVGAIKKFSSAMVISIIIIFISSVFLPLTVLVLFTLFVLLGLLAKKMETNKISETGVILPTVFVFGSGLLLLTAFWFGFKWYQAEYYLRSSLNAGQENKGAEAYNLQIKAINANPYSERIRLAYSQTNLALAVALARKENLTDQDRNDISTLVQQAIREAKMATALDPGKAANWENLAFIYRNLLNAAAGADQWAIAAYNQAIKLDPLNPLLRLDLGGVFYSLKNYDAAIQQFTIAVNLKPDWANAHYNLSYAFKDKGDIQNAFNEMQNTLALVQPGSDDFNKVSAELEELKKKLPPTPTPTPALGQPSSETLTRPQTEMVEVSPKIELPEKEAAPEIPPESPTPTSEPVEPTPTSQL